MITTFASLACEPLGDGRRREAGEDRHLDRADVRDRVRGDGDLGRHRQEDRDAVARADAERDELLGEPRHVARELGERERAARAVLAEADRRDGVRAADGPAVDAVARDRDPAAREPGRPLGPARVVEARGPTAARTRGRGRRRRAARTSPDRPASGARARRSRRRRPCARGGSRSRARPSPRRASRRPRAHARKPTCGLSRLASANLARANLARGRWMDG